MVQVFFRGREAAFLAPNLKSREEVPRANVVGLVCKPCFFTVKPTHQNGRPTTIHTDMPLPDVATYC